MFTITERRVAKKEPNQTSLKVGFYQLTSLVRQERWNRLRGSVQKDPGSKLKMPIPCFLLKYFCHCKMIF